MTLINRAAMAFYMVRLRRDNSTMTASKLFKAQAGYARELVKKAEKKDREGCNKEFISALNRIVIDCNWDAVLAPWGHVGCTYSYSQGDSALDVINKVKNRNKELRAIETQLIPRIC